MDGPAREPRQLVLDLGVSPALGRDDFIAADENRLALAFIERWPDWPSPAAMLVGPAGAGKTHLAAIWRALSAAREIAAARLSLDDAPRLIASGACVIENVGKGGLDERALFHLMNLAYERGAFLLLTARRPAAALDLALPDLKSRLKALPTVEIGAPDERLLAMVLVKLLADRQLVADPGVVDYLVSRMERSLAMAREAVERLDRLSLESRRPITRPLAARVLDEMRRPGG